MIHADFVETYLTGPGVEIGAFTRPIPGINPVYLDRFAEYAGEPTKADYYGDACEVPYYDSSLNYVASSHLLEHVANPVAAIREWFRVIRHGGFIYMVVPIRQKSFDHTRPLTMVEHMLDDWKNGVNQSDGTHIDEFVFGVDWKMFSPSTPSQETETARKQMALAYHQSVQRGSEINIHFHTFVVESLVQLLHIGNRESIWPGTIEILETVENFPDDNPDGFLIVGRVHKHILPRIKTLFTRKGLRKNARKPDKT
jgi:SAM-dependent methyltransferase